MNKKKLKEELTEKLNQWFWIDRIDLETIAEFVLDFKLSYEKERIIEILENHFGSLTGDGYTILEQIATQILGDDNND